jgi:hypothetical protein
MDDAVGVEQPLLQSRVEVAEIMPKEGHVLIPVSDAEPGDVDAARDLAAIDQDVVEREVAVSHDGINGHVWQLAHHLIPDLRRRASGAFGVEIGGIDAPGGQSFLRLDQA